MSSESRQALGRVTVLDASPTAIDLARARLGAAPWGSTQAFLFSLLKRARS